MTKFKLTLFFDRKGIIKRQKSTDDYEALKKCIEDMSDREIRDMLDLASITLKDTFWEKVNETLRLRVEQEQRKINLEKIIYVMLLKKEVSGFLLLAIVEKEGLLNKYFTEDGKLLPGALD